MQARYEWLSVMLIALIAVETPYFLWMSSWFSSFWLLRTTSYFINVPVEKNIGDLLKDYLVIVCSFLSHFTWIAFAHGYNGSPI
jgi:hypothetical protein